MKKNIVIAAVTAAFAFGVAGNAFAGDDKGAALFKKKCGLCHKLDKKAMGPAVKDMSQDEALLKSTITDGRKSMPKFGEKLSGEEIAMLVAYIRSQHTEKK